MNHIQPFSLHHKPFPQNDKTSVMWTTSLLLNISLLVWKKKEERNILFNDGFNTFYLWLYGIRHMVKDHSDSERGGTEEMKYVFNDAINTFYLRLYGVGIMVRITQIAREETT